MSWNLAFLALNAAVLPAWLLLWLFPRQGVTRAVVHSGLYPVAFGVVYAVSLGAALFAGQSDPAAGMGSLSGVEALFDHPYGVITGWTHFLVFDLFVGAWIARDAARLGIGHFAALPSLVLSFVFGPLGLLIWMMTRRITGKGGFSLDEGT